MRAMATKVSVTQQSKVKQAASWGTGGLTTCPGCTGAIGDNSPIPQGAASLINGLRASQGAGRLEQEATEGGWVGQVDWHSLPPGHRFFRDCDREQCARWIDWAMHLAGGCWFSTLTFKDYTSVYRAEKMNRRWLARLSQAHKDTTGAGGTKSFCATEWQQREVIHYHLLIFGAGLDALSRKRWEHRWGVNGGGFARNYDAVMKAAPYLAKYMNKRLGGELQIGGAWLGSKPPKAISRCCHGGQYRTLGL
jgi:hypothetical protein